MAIKENDPKVLILFLRYGDTYKGAYEELVKICERITLPKRMVVIHNDREDMGPRQKGEWVYEMGGDNSVYEFSGWQKALRSEVSVSFSPDVYMLVNDAFLAKRFYATPVIDDDMFRILAGKKVIGGNLRRNSFSIKYKGMELQDYVTTHFFLMSREALDALGTLVSEADPDRFVKPRFSEEIFTDNEIWTEKFKKYLTASLTGKYHEKGKTVSPEHYGFLKRKVIAVVNELLLSARAREAGIRLADMSPFPGFLNLYNTFFTPFGIVRPFQFLRRIALDPAHAFFGSRFSRTLGWDERFRETCAQNLKKKLSRQLA